VKSSLFQASAATSPSTLRQALALAGFIVITFCAPLLGIFSKPDLWYEALNKPEWNPPGLLMAVAAWLVWRRVGWQKVLMFYFIQLALNAAWTPIFFGAHELGWALAEILLMWLAILLTMRVFFQVSKPAGWMLVPYLAWVTFAAFLNFTLWRMNSF